MEKAVQGSEGIEVEEVEEAAGMEMRILPTRLRPAAQEILPCGREGKRKRKRKRFFSWGKGRAEEIRILKKNPGSPVARSQEADKKL